MYAVSELPACLAALHGNQITVYTGVIEAWAYRKGLSIMGKWILITSCAVVASVAAVLIGQARESSSVEKMLATLNGSANGAAAASNIDVDSIFDLPSPVARYFQHVLGSDHRLIKVASLQQSGTLRTSTAAESWSAFTATQVVTPTSNAFLWNAKVELPLATHVRVLDSYINGMGAGRVSFLSSLVVASEADKPELNSGALHRYLAEGVWFPTALLPQSGVQWQALDDNSALATLNHSGVTVSVEFRFNEVGEITGIYSDGRFGRFDGEYKIVPWEGHFRDYQVRGGLRIPLYGEVGWYEDGSLELVWKGYILDAQYDFE